MNAAGDPIAKAVDSVLREAGKTASGIFLDKCIKFYQISCVQQGIIVCGSAGNGKSTVISTVINALSQPKADGESVDSSHKFIKMYPLVTDQIQLILGSISKDGEWIDGVLTSTWKKINRNQSTTWLCLDGPITSNWAGIFNTVLDSTHRMTLPTGDELFMSSNVKVVFETDDLSTAAPAIVSKCGIVFIDHSAVGWRPLAKAWLENRSSQETSVLSKAFNKTVDPVCNFICNECKPPIRLTDTGMFTTTLHLLSAMLADNIEIGGDLHIERLFIFCLMWSFGAFLDQKERKQFSELLTTLTTSLPDDDRDICVFDYYVDDSGEWDPWTARVPEMAPLDHVNLLQEPFIDTIGTIQTRMLLDFAAQNGQNVLILGSAGCGKSTMMDDYLSSLESAKNIIKRVVFSGSSIAYQFQQFIESNITHRQGFVYGAKDNKSFKLFADDINLPRPDEYGVVRVSEMIRQLVDSKLIITQSAPFEWRIVEGLSVLATMKVSKQPAFKNKSLNSRLMRHFCVLNFPDMSDEALKTIFRGILECAMLQNDKPGLDIEVYDRIVHGLFLYYFKYEFKSQ